MQNKTFDCVLVCDANRLIDKVIEHLRCGRSPIYCSAVLCCSAVSSYCRLCLEERPLLVDWNDFPNWIQFLIEM